LRIPHILFLMMDPYFLERLGLAVRGYQFPFCSLFSQMGNSLKPGPRTASRRSYAFLAGVMIMFVGLALFFAYALLTYTNLPHGLSQYQKLSGTESLLKSSTGKNGDRQQLLAQTLDLLREILADIETQGKKYKQLLQEWPQLIM
jgi:hypothetical protein